MKHISDHNQSEYNLAYGSTVNEAAAGSGQEVPLPFPQELGEGRAVACLFSADLGYGILDIREAAESGKISVRATDNFIKLTLHLSCGSSLFNVDGFSKTLSVKKGDGYILSGSAFGHIDVLKGDRLREFSLFVSECKFHEMNEELQLRWSGETERELFSLSQRRGYLKSPAVALLSGQRRSLPVFNLRR